MVELIYEIMKPKKKKKLKNLLTGVIKSHDTLINSWHSKALIAKDIFSSDKTSQWGR